MIELKYEKGKKISFHWLVSWRSKVYEYSSMGNDVKETILEFPRKICLHKQENSKETSPSALLTMPKPLTVWITINWEILREMGIPDHLTCLLRNLYAGQEATVRTGHGKQTGSK